MFGYCKQDAERMAATRKAEKAAKQAKKDQMKIFNQKNREGQPLHDVYYFPLCAQKSSPPKVAG